MKQIFIWKSFTKFWIDIFCGATIVKVIGHWSRVNKSRAHKDIEKDHSA